MIGTVSTSSAAQIGKGLEPDHLPAAVPEIRSVSLTVVGERGCVLPGERGEPFLSPVEGGVAQAGLWTLGIEVDEGLVHPPLLLRRLVGALQVADDAFIAPTASLVGDVYIGPGAKVFPGAAVVGPAYVGAGAIVGNNALVRGSMVLDNCNVGFTTEVARSYVAAGCQMHACRVLDSVFAPDVNFSAGCTTANLRIDHGPVPSKVKGDRLSTGRDKLGAIIGQGAFLGVDVMTMPGVKVGEAAQVGPGTHVMRDVADHQRVYVKQEQVLIDGEDA